LERGLDAFGIVSQLLRGWTLPADRVPALAVSLNEGRHRDDHRHDHPRATRALYEEMRSDLTEVGDI